ncbi:MAG: O-antigen ligase family protein, partial [Clostridia bacterium]|nr:O-antigen ligase family protein [Clostridia bacterium]
ICNIISKGFEMVFKKSEKFMHSPYFIAGLAFITLLCWYLDVFIVGMIIFAAIFSFVLLFYRDTTPLIPIIVLCTFMISRVASEFDFTPYIIGIAPVLVISLILYFVLKRPKFKKGLYFYGLAAALIAMTTAGIGFDYQIAHILTVCGLTLTVIFVYFFFNSTATNGVKQTVLNSFIAAAIVSLLQILIFYIRAEDFMYAVTHKTLNLGWGISNNVAVVLSMFLPITFYRILKSKYYLLYIVFAFAQLIGILFTLSRGNILFSAAAFVAFFALLIIISQRRFAIIIGIIAIVTVLLAIAMIFPDVFKPIIDRLIKMELTDNGRFVLLREGIESFKLNPIFGIGFYYKHADIPHWFHNSVVQILASTGIFGSLLYGVFFYQRYSVPFKKFNTSNFFMICCVILSGLYGFLECNFFFVYNNIFIIFIYIVIEREEDTDNFFKVLFKRKTKID